MVQDHFGDIGGAQEDVSRVHYGPGDVRALRIMSDPLRIDQDYPGDVGGAQDGPGDVGHAQDGPGNVGRAQDGPGIVSCAQHGPGEGRFCLYIVSTFTFGNIRPNGQ